MRVRGEGGKAHLQLLHFGLGGLVGFQRILTLDLLLVELFLRFQVLAALHDLVEQVGGGDVEITSQSLPHGKGGPGRQTPSFLVPLFRVNSDSGPRDASLENGQLGPLGISPGGRHLVTGVV